MKAEALVSLGRELSQLKPTWEKKSQYYSSTAEVTY